MKKFLLVCLLVLSIALLPLTGLCQEGITLDLSKGDVIITADGYTQAEKTEKAAGPYTIIQSDPAVPGLLSVNGAKVEITLVNLALANAAASPIDIFNEAQVTLIFDGINTLDGSLAENKAGLRVATDSALILQAANEDAFLDVKGGFHGAGIGGNNEETAGSITIKNGTINTLGGVAGAGIGGGFSGHGGNITIENGYIIATGNEAGAGIGGGWIGNCGNVVILDGVIEATGGARAAAIGNGSDMGGGFITIKGGTINATAGLSSSAIGGGLMSQQGCTIVVEGGIVNATAVQDGAGIGSGFAINYATKDGGTLLITGGSVTEYSTGYEYLNAIVTLRGGEYMSKTTITDGIILEGGTLKIMSTGRSVVPQPIASVEDTAEIVINYHTKDVEDAETVYKVTGDFVLLTTKNPEVTAECFTIHGAPDAKLVGTDANDIVSFTIVK